MATNSQHKENITLNGVKQRQWIGFSVALGAFLLLLDQLSKLWIEQNFSLYESKEICSVFSITYVVNYGAAWSLFSGEGTILIIAAIVVLGGIAIFWNYLTEGFVERYFALFIIVSGVIGNSIDRIWRGSVVDFLDVHYQRWSWPVFNIADITICVGAGIFILSNLLRKSEKKNDNINKELTSPQEVETT